MQKFSSVDRWLVSLLFVRLYLWLSFVLYFLLTNEAIIQRRLVVYFRSINWLTWVKDYKPVFRSSRLSNYLLEIVCLSVCRSTCYFIHFIRLLLINAKSLIVRRIKRWRAQTPLWSLSNRVLCLDGYLNTVDSWLIFNEWLLRDLLPLCHGSGFWIVFHLFLIYFFDLICFIDITSNKYS